MIVGKKTAPENIVGRASRQMSGSLQRRCHGRNESPPPHRALNQTLCPEVGIGIAHCRPMHAQAPGKFPARVDSFAYFQRTRGNALANLVADLGIKRFVQTRIECEEHGDLVLLACVTSPIYAMK